MRYLSEHLEHLKRWAHVAIIVPAWECLQANFAGFWASSPFVWICVFWAMDWVFGGVRAGLDGWRNPQDPSRGWSARRAARSLLKLLLWLTVLLIAYGIRKSGIPYGGVPAGCLEAGVILTEAGSVLGHLAELSGSPTLRFLASKLRQQAAPEGDGK